MSDFWLGVFTGIIAPIVLAIAGIFLWMAIEGALFATGYTIAARRDAIAMKRKPTVHLTLRCFLVTWLERATGEWDGTESVRFASGLCWQPYFKFTPSKRLTDSK